MQDTNDIFKEFMIAECFTLLQDLHDMPECLLLFWPFVLQQHDQLSQHLVTGFLSTAQFLLYKHNYYGIRQKSSINLHVIHNCSDAKWEGNTRPTAL